MTDTAAAPVAAEPEHSAPGGPVHATGLPRIAGKLSRLPCGCSSDDSRWITLCDKALQDINSIPAAESIGQTRIARKAVELTDKEILL